MINELERVRKEVVRAYSRYDPGTCLGGLRKATKPQAGQQVKQCRRETDRGHVKKNEPAQNKFVLLQ
jgi:hypothetical protein